MTPECIDGDSKVEGGHAYSCYGGQWLWDGYVGPPDIPPTWPIGWVLGDSKLLTIQISEPVPEGWVLGDITTLSIEPSELVGPGGWALGDAATLSIQPSEPVGPGGWALGDTAVLTIQFIPNGPPEPPDDENGWLDWIKKHSIELGIGGLGVAGVILAWPKGGKK